MAFLNESEREQLRRDLEGKSFNAAKWKLQHIDPKGRLAYFRNSQRVNEWKTRFELVGLGTRVTLIETYDTKTDLKGRHKPDYKLVDVVVEPTPDNKT